MGEANGADTPINLADDVSQVVDRSAHSTLVVGMSLGGLTSVELTVRHPHLVRSLMLVDITPGADAAKGKAVIDFIDGPQSFPSFAELLARTVEHNPTRSESSLRRGVLHNAVVTGDGTWKWRYDRGSRARLSEAAAAASGAASEAVGVLAGDPAPMFPLWDDFGAVRCPMVLVRGSLSPVVDDDDVAEALRRQPDLEVHVVDGAGHSVQGDRPVELSELIGKMLAR